jgi:hypothetical protein
MVMSRLGLVWLELGKSSSTFPIRRLMMILSVRLATLFQGLFLYIIS